MHAPAEIYVLFSQYLDFRSVARLRAVCRAARNGLRTRKRLELGQVRLSDAQAAIRDAAIEMPDSPGGTPTNVFVLRAPMGFGKTIVGLSLPFADPADGHRYIFVVHPAAYDTWVAEVIKVFGSNARAVTPATRIVFAHSSIPHHNALAKRAVEFFEAGAPPGGEAKSPLGPGVRAVITTNTSSVGLALIKLWATRVVLDEAHVTPQHLWITIAPFPWIVALSANIVRPALNTFKVWRDNGSASSWVVAAGVMEGVVPVAKPRQIVVAPYGDEARQFGDSHDKRVHLERNLGAYVTALIGIFATIADGRVVLYLPDGDTSAEIVRAAPQYAPSWRITEFNRAVSKLRAFEAADRSILVMHHSKSVAVNIHATHLVIVRPDWVNPVRYAQIMGRVLRPLSPTASIDAFLVMPRGVPAIRTAFAEALRMLATAELHLEPPSFSALEFLKADTCLRACGSSVVGAAPAELLAVLGVALHDPSIANALLSRWAAGPVKTLTEPQVRSFLDLEPVGLTDADIDELLGGV
jgi:hypothetical protein